VVADIHDGSPEADPTTIGLGIRWSTTCLVLQPPFENALALPEEELMATTRTPGIAIDTEGFRTINKEHRGERIFARLGLVVQEQAERPLAQELERLVWELERRAHASPLFSGCATRFRREARHKRTPVAV